MYSTILGIDAIIYCAVYRLPSYSMATSSKSLDNREILLDEESSDIISRLFINPSISNNTLSASDLY